MLRLVLRRLWQFVPTFLGITFVTFALLKLAPGEPGELFSEGELHASEQSRAEWRQLRRLDEPLGIQYLEWLSHLVRLDFGRSFIDERLVSERIVEALPRTLLVAGGALVLTYALALPLGVWAAVRRGRRVDRLIHGALAALYSLPPFWAALLLLVALAGGELLSIFPLRGLRSPGLEDASLWTRALDLGWHLVLPVFCLAYPQLARTSRLQRSSLLEVLRQDFVRTARAKGLPEHRVVLGHALPNALSPMAAMLSIDLPALLGGSVIIERIFTIPGMGMLTMEAILRRDYPMIMGVTALAALCTMAAILAGDLLQLGLDPRARSKSS